MQFYLVFDIRKRSFDPILGKWYRVKFALLYSVNITRANSIYRVTCVRPALASQDGSLSLAFLEKRP